MIKNNTDPKWEQLIRGQLSINISQVPAQMMLNRCQRSLSRDDSPEAVKKLKEEVHAFFVKFESILQDEIKQLFG